MTSLQKPGAWLKLLACLLLVAGPVLAESVRYEFVPSSRAIMRVGPNQSLDLIVQQIYPDHQKLWPRIKQEIHKRNPQAFNQYTGRLMAGQRLQLVTVKTIHETELVTVTQAGSVQTVKGYAVVTDKNGKEGRLMKDSLVYEGDRLITAKGARLVVKMIDGAELRIKSDSAVRITEYRMTSGFETGSRSIIDLIKGGLRKITGSIGANPLSVYRFHTGVMTIGVRGTDYVVKLCRANDCEQSAGRNGADTNMHVVVLDGLISLQDEEGAQGELALGQYAVASSDKVVKVDDAHPASGLLNSEEQMLFEKLEPLAKEERSIWPWLLGGALLGL